MTNSPPPLPHELLPELSYEEAVQLLQRHAGADPEGLTDDCLADSLHGFYGPVNTKAFEEVMASLKAIGPTLSQEQLPNAIVQYLWCICAEGYGDTVNPNRVRQRNELVSPKATELEQRWLHCISWAVYTFLHCDDVKEAFEGYDGFMQELAKQDGEVE